MALKKQQRPSQQHLELRALSSQSSLSSHLLQVSLSLGLSLLLGCFPKDSGGDDDEAEEDVMMGGAMAGEVTGGVAGEMGGTTMNPITPSGPPAPFVVRFEGDDIESGAEIAPVTSDGIPPYSFSSERLTIANPSAEQVTISQIEVIPLEPSHPDEWYIVEAGSTSLIPIEVVDLSVAPEETFDFSVFFRPIESGPRSAVVVITWGDAHRYTVQVNARGRDNATLSPVIRAEADYLYSKRPANTLVGGGVNAGDAFCFGQNVNEWSDTFSENIAVTCLNADGSLKWSKEWSEDFEQLQPDPGQNAEAGGAAESIAYGSEGALYIVGQRSQENYNSLFQGLVARINPVSGDLVWATGLTRGADEIPAMSNQSIKAYAVDATLGDRVLVTGQVADSQGALLAAFSKDDGSLIWSLELNVTSGSVDRGYAIAADEAGNVFIGGLTSGKGMLLKVVGAETDSPELEWARSIELGTGSAPNSLALDGEGGVFAALDIRGATTTLALARFNPAGETVWAKAWDPANGGDNNNSYVVRHINDEVILGGRVALQPFDTQFGEGFVMSLNPSDGSWNYGAFYYSGKGTEEIAEHRVKGLGVREGGLWMLQQGYPGPNNEDHYWGRWYQLNDDTLEVPAGDGSGRLADYDFNNAARSMPVEVAPLEGATGHVIDTTMIWRDAPMDATLDDPRDRAGNNGTGFTFIEQLSVTR